MTWFCRLSLRHTGCILGIVPGKDYPTGFPVRSHQLALPETAQPAVDGELHRHND